MITHEELLDTLEYDSVTGKFFRKKTIGGQRKGSLAGKLDKDGYRVIKIKGRIYRAHRLAWFYLKRVWPKKHLDHINNVRDDNRIENLREATIQENACNKKMYASNKSGIKGVCYDPKKKKWVMQIRILNGKRLVKRFRLLSEAEEAIKKAREELHGEFAKHE